jgi:hypothetical protein
MPPRTRHFLRELLGQSIFLGLGAGPLVLGGWLATSAWAAPASTWRLVAGGVLGLVGVFLVAQQLRGLWDTVARYHTLPSLRRPPTEAEVAAYRACLERALAALAATPDPRSPGLPSLADSLRLEHANAADALREPIATGFLRWASGEVDLARWGPAYAKVCDALAAVSAQHANHGRTAAKP